MNVAFKTTYNNGGEGYQVGFAGTCSNQNIVANILNNRVWCSNANCPCRVFYDGGLRGETPARPCMESELFLHWNYGAGEYHNGKRAGQPKRLKKVNLGDICILTTRFPNEAESERKITGLFRVGEMDEDVDGGVFSITAERKIRLRLPLEEARQLNFWNYYDTKGGAFWGSGLQRYLPDESVACILFDLLETLRDFENREIVGTILRENFPHFSHRPKCLAAISRPPEERLEAVNTLRKYGLGGEGIDHKDLKNHIAEHPEAIGFRDVKMVKIEFPFLSGDQVDLLFEHRDGTYSVVEIETNYPLPGAHQAIKYRSLLCAKLKLPLNSDKVRAVLVAWDGDENLASFCSQYAIHFKRVRL